MSVARSLAVVVILVLAAIIVLPLVILWPYLEGQTPEINLAKPLTHLGKLTPLGFTVKDEGTGLSLVKVSLSQGTKEVTLLEKKYPGFSLWDRKGEASADFTLEIKAQELNLAQGPATVVIEARDRSFRGFFHGNQSRLELPVVVATIPPRLNVLSRTIHLNRGGVGLAVYKATENTAVHGVQVGGRTFYGYTPWSQDPQARLCYFAFADDENQNAPIRVFAQDAAGNQAVASLNVRLKWREFKHDNLNIGDEFLNAINGRFAAEAPPERQRTPLDVFLWINEDLRKVNHQVITETLAKGNTYQLWQGTFLRPPGKPMAGYADRRSYMYKGKEVSTSVHLGVDLADLAASPVKVVAAGTVVFSGPLGIYGNALIVDHGQGIATLYGHLSELEVAAGQTVAADQELGRSGATGLALGDHLHFSVLVGGVFVNPTEWWDPHWIQDNVDLRFQEAGLPAPRPGK
jgi:murein DD-endopeptidase MepM/ murein hydrolase activator NlpD